MIEVFEMQEDLLYPRRSESIQCRVVEHESIEEYQRKTRETMEVLKEICCRDATFNFQWVMIGRNNIGMYIRHIAYWQEK